MKILPEQIKMAFAQELEKTGHTIEDLEVALKNNANIKTAGASAALAGLAKATPGLLNLGGLVSIGTGALGGAGIYAGYKANENSNEKILKKMKERQQYIEATKALQAALQNQQAL
ncbi:conserved hypothetical protein [Gammaproteobacteria bacterium]